MMYGRRRFGLGSGSPLVCCAVLALIVLSSAGVLAFDTEVVSPRMYTMSTRGGGQQTVPDLAVSGRVLVELAPGTTMAQLQDRLAANKCTLTSAIPNTRVVVVGLPEGMSVVEGRDLWASETVAAAAEPDYLKYATAVPDDPLYPQQWHWPKISAPTGWDIETGTASTVVAICDSGYDPDHEDLVDKYWVNQAELAGNPGEDDDGNGYVDDIHGWDFIDDDNDPDAGPVASGDLYTPGAVCHGSHAGGLVGATTDNGIGVAGHDWACQLMMVRVLDLLGSGTDSTVVAGVQYAIDNGADVINLSIGGAYSSIYNSVFATANAAGVVIVCAAGNESWVFTDDPATWMSPVCNDGDDPSATNNVLGVGATDSADIAASFTNRDASSYNFVDVMAPGVDVLSTLYYNPTFPDLATPYGPMSGTSMACPIAAGLAALVKGHFPSFSANDVINQIRGSCDDISEQNPLIADTLGQGRINTAGALGLDVPPDPVTNLQARDTLGDEGGSITVTWTLPPQDDDDVTGYNVLRAPESDTIPGAPGNFSQIASLEPGTDAFIDAPVPDHTPYWYQVNTLDASNIVPSATAGPAIARDDLPPAAVDNLVAVDTQADQGGAITLSWHGYDPPDDIAEYRIYRAGSEFTDVSAMEPLATQSPGAALHYVDRTTVDGTEYYYAVTGVDDEENEETTVTPAGPAISNPNFAFEYPAGLSIIAVGAVPSDPAARHIADILGIDDDGDSDLAYWDPTLDGGAYVIWSTTPNAAVFQQALGRAWWLKTDEPIVVNVSGEGAPAGDFEQQVVAGWNQLGNPFAGTLNFADTEVTGIGQGTPVSLQTSNQLGYTRDYAWGYDPFENSYRLITGANLPFASSEIESGEGVLFLARRPATLVLKEPTGVAAAARDEERPSFDGWALRLVAEAGEVADTDNFLGVSSCADQLNGVISPPRPDTDLDLYFVRPGAADARLATDFAQSQDEAEWQIRVACTMPGATVRLSWPDLSQLPADCRPVLTDNRTGRSVYLRTSTGYSYDVGDEPGEAAFTLRIAGDGAEALAVNALSVAPAGGGAQVAYSLSRAGSVDIEVLNIAGRTVRRLVADRAQEAGPQQVTWDGRNASGAPAPAGTYLVRVRARAADGQQVSAIRSLQLDR